MLGDDYVNRTPGAHALLLTTEGEKVRLDDEDRFQALPRPRAARALAEARADGADCTHPRERERERARALYTQVCRLSTEVRGEGPFSPFAAGRRRAVTFDRGGARARDVCASRRSRPAQPRLKMTLCMRRVGFLDSVPRRRVVSLAFSKVGETGSYVGGDRDARGLRRARGARALRRARGSRDLSLAFDTTPRESVSFPVVSFVNESSGAL